RAAHFRLIFSPARYTTAYETGAVAILFPSQKKARRREYLASAAVWPLVGSVTLSTKAAQETAALFVAARFTKAGRPLFLRNGCRYRQVPKQRIKDERPNQPTIVSARCRIVTRHRRCVRIRAIPFASSPSRRDYRFLQKGQR